MFKQLSFWYLSHVRGHARIQRGGGGQGSPPKNHINIGFLSNTGPGLRKNHKSTKPEFNVEPSSAR